MSSHEDDDERDVPAARALLVPSQRLLAIAQMERDRAEAFAKRRPVYEKEWWESSAESDDLASNDNKVVQEVVPPKGVQQPEMKPGENTEEPIREQKGGSNVEKRSPLKRKLREHSEGDECVTSEHETQRSPKRHKSVMAQALALSNQMFSEEETLVSGGAAAMMESTLSTAIPYRFYFASQFLIIILELC